MRGVLRGCALTVFVCACCAGNAAAFSTTTDLGAGVSVSVYAPDWIWQDRDINILVVARNTGPVPVTVRLELVWPEGRATCFKYADETEKTLEAAPGQTAREAFAGITALEHGPGGQPIPLEHYRFVLLMRGNGQEKAIPYPLSTIRGAVVAPGALALYLPAGIALAWCVVFYIALARMSDPWAWFRRRAERGDWPAPPDWVHETPDRTGGQG